jgi:hypothetical protein
LRDHLLKKPTTVVAQQVQRAPETAAGTQSSGVNPGKEIAEYLGLRHGLSKKFSMVLIKSPGSPALKVLPSLWEVVKGTTTPDGTEGWRMKGTLYGGKRPILQEWRVSPVDVRGISQQVTNHETGKTTTSTSADSPVSVLGWPLVPGTKWAGGEIVSIEDVDTGPGKFLGCIKVVSTNGVSSQTTWYCRGVGVVKQETPLAPSGRTTATLDDFSPRYSDVRLVSWEQRSRQALASNPGCYLGKYLDQGGAPHLLDIRADKTFSSRGGPGGVAGFNGKGTYTVSGAEIELCTQTGECWVYRIEGKKLVNVGGNVMFSFQDTEAWVKEQGPGCQ